MSAERQREFEKKGYTKAEVEILVNLATIDAEVKTISKNYVTKDEFAPIQKLVYGLVTLVLVAVVSGLVTLVMQ